MSEQAEKTQMSEDKAPPEEVVLPPLIPTPVEKTEDPPVEAAKKASEVAEEAPAEAAEEATEQAEEIPTEAVEEPPAEAAEEAPAEAAEEIPAEAVEEAPAEAAEEAPAEAAEEAPVEAAEEPPAEAAEEAPVEAAEEPPAKAAEEDEKSTGPSAQETAEEETFERPRTLRDLKPGMVLEGKITSVAIYGAFVDIGVGREGLVPLSQLSDQPVSSPTDVVHLGDMVSVRVVKVDPRKKRISLSMREPSAGRKAVAAKLAELKSGTVMDGIVASLTRFGAFVDIGVGRDGLIPMSHLPQGKTESLQVGEEIRVRIVDVDRKANRIRLSMRNVHDTEQLDSLNAGDIVQGKITSLAAFGAFVDVGVGKDGLIHVSNMGDSDVRHPREVLKVGEAVEVRILDVDPETQRISLTMQLEDEEAEEDWVFEPEEEEEEPLGEVTLEDLAARFNKMRVEGQPEQDRRTSRAEREKRAVREALQRTLDTVKDE